MKVLKIIVLSLTALGLIFSAAFAMKHMPEERGKALFNDAKFAGGTKACNSCHPDGSGLEKAGDKKEFNLMGKAKKSLEEVVNACIAMGNRGEAIDIESEQMKDIVAYIKSLGKTAQMDMPMHAPGY